MILLQLWCARVCNHTKHLHTCLSMGRKQPEHFHEQPIITTYPTHGSTTVQQVKPEPLVCLFQLIDTALALVCKGLHSLKAPPHMPKHG